MKNKLGNVLMVMVGAAAILVMSSWGYSEFKHSIQEEKQKAEWKNEELERMQQFENNESDLLEKIEKIKEDNK